MQTNLLALLKLLFQNNKVIHFAQKPIQNIIIKLPTLSEELEIYSRLISAPFGILFFSCFLSNRKTYFLLKKQVLVQQTLRIHYSNE